jgi:hypothetical protein
MGGKGRYKINMAGLDERALGSLIVTALRNTAAVAANGRPDAVAQYQRLLETVLQSRPDAFQSRCPKRTRARGR